MAMSEFYSAGDDRESIATIHRAGARDRLPGTTEVYRRQQVVSRHEVRKCAARTVLVSASAGSEYLRRACDVPIALSAARETSSETCAGADIEGFGHLTKPPDAGAIVHWIRPAAARGASCEGEAASRRRSSRQRPTCRSGRVGAPCVDKGRRSPRRRRPHPRRPRRCLFRRCNPISHW